MTHHVVKIFVDFNNCDEGGYVRLNTRGSLSDLRKYKVILKSGLSICLSDGEMTVNAVVKDPGSEGVWRAMLLSALPKGN